MHGAAEGTSSRAAGTAADRLAALAQAGQDRLDQFRT
jgi:hypothetical protein